jgi:hypothetical protein
MKQKDAENSEPNGGQGSGASTDNRERVMQQILRTLEPLDEARTVFLLFDAAGPIVLRRHGFPDLSIATDHSHVSIQTRNHRPMSKRRKLLIEWRDDQHLEHMNKAIIEWYRDQ